MLDEMSVVGKALAALLPVLIAAVVALTKLRDQQNSRLRLAANVGLVLIALYAAIEVVNLARSRFEAARKIRGTSRYVAPMINGSFSEASGATYIGKPGDREYVLAVDDEQSALFVLRFDAKERDYPNVARHAIDVGGEPIDDLEDLASYEGKAYAITSHSKQDGGGDGSRERLIRIEFPNGFAAQPSVTASQRLGDGLVAVLKRLNADGWRTKRGKLEVMNIEGLAIDAGGLAYVGFRSPLIDDQYALLLQAPVASLFDAPGPIDWKVARLDLSYSEEDEVDLARYRRHVSTVYHGIVSLAYDGHSDRILVLSNAQYKEAWYKPVLWSFPAGPFDSDAEVFAPDKCDAGESDVTSAGKAEAIVVHPVAPGSFWTRPIALLRGGNNGPISLFYDVVDRPALFRVLDRYDLCDDIRRRKAD
jgi:hypothetical protein